MSATTLNLLVALVAILLGAVAIGLGMIQSKRMSRIENRLSRRTAQQVHHDATTIEEWTRAMNDAPEGSPKRTAYRNRLAALGALDGDQH